MAIAAAAPFVDSVTAAGLEHRVLPGDPRTARRSKADQRWQSGGRGVRGGIAMTRLLAQHRRDLGDAMIAGACRDTDVVMLSGPTYPGGADVAEGLVAQVVGGCRAVGTRSRSMPNRSR